eukprot:TRINITY_DN81205_c0_g1_i1.p1 TRINITY_DN81205_c0_g1~~TRINITY_DN81205_c0_g1_i1.p1  ORF type:complete len:348 (+),score=74.39 TRINITY_DN81205_c0_g1_i1:30-1073(+)
MAAACQLRLTSLFRRKLTLPKATVCVHRSFASDSGKSSEFGRDDDRVRLLLDTKVSQSGSADALLQDAVDSVRARRAELELDRAFRQVDTAAVTKLKQDELELTRKIFQRVDPTEKSTSNLSHAGHDIDPYWNPFAQVRDLKNQVTAEFDEYARYVSVAEAKRTKIQIKKSLRRMSDNYNPYSSSFRDYHDRKAGDQMPKPFRLPDKYWEPTPLQVRLANEKITFRDVDIIQHFIAENGYILPRRTTMLTRKKQQELVKAVRIAQCMSLLPYKFKLKDYQAMPLTDPLQWTADRLTDRVREHRDRRSRAMLQVMMERYPELNFRNFLKLEAERKQREAAMGGGAPPS